MFANKSSTNYSQTTNSKEAYEKWIGSTTSTIQTPKQGEKQNQKIITITKKPVNYQLSQPQQSYDYNSWKLGNKYKAELNLKVDEVVLLNKVGFYGMGRNDFCIRRYSINVF